MQRPRAAPCGDDRQSRTAFWGWATTAAALIHLIMTMLALLPTGAATPRARAVGPSADALLERGPELALLARRIAALRGPEPAGGCVLLSAEAGGGKTSLLAEAARRADADVEWLRGACEPMLSSPPLGALIDLLERLPPAVAAAVRTGLHTPEVIAGVLALLRDRRTPAVLVIDDVHWADGATLDLLRYVGRRIESTRALLVLSYRGDALGADHPLRSVLGGLPPRSCTRIELAPLSGCAIAELAQRAGRSANGVHRLTHGNPFFVTELLAGDAQALPASVRDAVLARAAPLSANARDVLDLASVAPAQIEIDVLEAVIDDAHEAIAACAAAGLLHRDGAVLRFRHELARRAIEAALAPGRAAALHGVLFDALSQRDTPAVRLIHHADRAGLGAAVLRLAPLAAFDATAASAHRQAADLLALAVRESSHLPDAQRAPLAEAYAHACMACHRFDEALRARRQTLALHVAIGDQFAQGRDLRELARIEWFLGEIESGVEYAAQAIATLERVGAERELAMACATMAQLHIMDESPKVAVEWGRRALVTFEATDDAEGLAYALNTVGFGELLADGGLESWARLERSLSIAREYDMEEPVGRAYANLASQAVLHRRFDALRRWCEEGIVHCEARDQDMFVARLRVRMAFGLMEQGQWQAGVEELARLDSLPLITPLEQEQSAHVLALLQLRRGVEAADAYWQAQIEGHHALSVDPWYAPQAVARCEAAWLRGDDTKVRHIASAALGSAVRSGERWRIGQLACWLRRAGGLLPPGVQPLAPPCVLELAGDLRAAADAWAALGCPYEQALALLGGDEADLRHAHALLDELGAAPAARIARRRLRALGVRDLQRGANRCTRTDPLGLTARERQVLELLAQQLSNRAIAQRLHRSERTVENHVAALLGKLGVTSRTDAAALARALEK
jgi:DNA-binding CsgD family transcriptional regulator